MRWPKRNNLSDLTGRVLNAWKVTRGRRSVDHRYRWHTHLKLLLMVTLAYAFLLSLLDVAFTFLRE